MPAPDPELSNRDWQGMPIPDDETDDTTITVWEVDPHISDSRYDIAVVRSRWDLLCFLEEHVELWLDRYSEADLRAGVTLKIRLCDMSKRDYAQITAAEE